jgi:serine/threonine-protein kinase
VSWEEAQAYCQWAGLVLPSEAQWEAAARGPDGRRYPWGNEEPTAEHANFGNREGATTPVGAYPRGAGPFGTLDQAGNVWEWCVDIWDDKAYRRKERAKEDPVSARGDGAVRCLRGGAWFVYARYLAAAYRYGYRASVRFQYFGFRCASAPR